MKTRGEDTAKSYHKVLEPRLTGIYEALLANSGASRTGSSSSKGSERELFVSRFLSQIFPPIYRFASGDITDIYEQISGQIDIVAEHPLMCSFPTVENSPRLFLAESVAFAIEVKSSLGRQWTQVLRTARKLKSLKRFYKRDGYLRDSKGFARVATERPEQAAFYTEISNTYAAKARGLPPGPSPRIPLYVVGYEGWKDKDELTKKLTKAQNKGLPLVDGVLQLKPLRFMTFEAEGCGQFAEGPLALLTFIDALEWHFNQNVVPNRLAWTYLVETKHAREESEADQLQE